MYMKQVRLSTQGIRFYRLQVRMVKLLQRIWTTMCRDFMRMTVMNIWCFREWFIFHFRQSMEHYIRKRNFRIFMKYVRKEIFRYILMVQGLVMDLPAVKMM